MTRRTRIPAVARLAALALLWGAPGAVRAAEPDAWITTKAKMALLTADGVPGSRINVDTVDGRVTLHGTVPTAAEKQAAERIVRGIDGVRDVRDLVQVRSEAGSTRAEARDDELRERVNTALDRQPALRTVEVASVHDGVVLLSGRVPTLSDHLAAMETASQVPGVRRVASEIESPDRLADAELWEEGGKGKAESGTVAGSARDVWITSAVKMRLLADERTPGLDVNVDTTAGRVTLFGIVATADAKAAAEEDARRVAGVQGVDNALQVVPAQRQDVVKATDADVQEHVKDALAAHEPLGDAGIGVQVENGIVRLTGTVPSQDQRLRAAVVARAAPGVRAVRDDLRVEHD